MLPLLIVECDTHDRRAQAQGRPEQYCRPVAEKTLSDAEREQGNQQAAGQEGASYWKCAGAEEAQVGPAEQQDEGKESKRADESALSAPLHIDVVWVGVTLGYDALGQVVVTACPESFEANTGDGIVQPHLQSGHEQLTVDGVPQVGQRVYHASRPVHDPVTDQKYGCAADQEQANATQADDQVSRPQNGDKKDDEDNRRSGQERGSTLACEKDEYGQEQPEHEHQKVLSEEMFAGWLQAGEQYPTRHYGESDACDKAADIGAAQRSGEASAINRLSARRYPGCQLDQTIRNRHEQCRRPRNTDELEFGSGWNQPTGHGGEENDKSQPWQTACKRGMRVHRQRRDDQNQGRPGQQ